MHKRRVIARIDIKNNHAIKGIQLEGLRKVGEPNNLAKSYYEEGIDEIVFMDAVAAYYDRNSLSDIIIKATQDVFVPITVGGGIRTIEDIKKALDSGADKVAINTQAVRTPEFITEASKIFGSQCIVGSIEAKKGSQGWEAYIENGREPTGLDVMVWAKRLEALGAGEIMITAVDRDGTKKGFDIDLVAQVEQVISIPLIVSGGAGKSQDILKLFTETNVDAVAVASVLHYQVASVSDIKSTLLNAKCEVRT